jgi:hypothetical protein
MTLFFVQLLRYSPATLVKRFSLVVAQVFNAGALSIVIIMVSGLFVGGVLGLQTFSSLELFNAEDATGILVGFALVKEIGPVITALLFAGRAGTALTSEIGLLRNEGVTVRDLPRELVPGIDYSALAIDPDGHAIELYCSMEQVGWDGRSRPAAERRGSTIAEWPEVLEPLSDTFLGEAYLGPWN